MSPPSKRERIPLMQGLDWDEPIPDEAFCIFGDARDIMACYGDDDEPRTQVNLIIEPASTGRFIRPPLQILPARLSLREICQSFPKQVTGTGLRLFIQGRWTARKMFEAMREEDRSCSASKKYPEMPFQASMGREKARMKQEMEGSHVPVSDAAEAIEHEKRRLRWVPKPAAENPSQAVFNGGASLLPVDPPALGIGEEAQKETIELTTTTLTFRPKTQTQEPHSDDPIPYVVSLDRVGEDDHKRYVELALEHSWDKTPIEVIEAIAEEFGYPNDISKGSEDATEDFIRDDVWDESKPPQESELTGDLDIAHAFDLPEDLELPLDFDFNATFGNIGETDYLQDLASSSAFDFYQRHDLVGEEDLPVRTVFEKSGTWHEHSCLLPNSGNDADNSIDLE